MIGMPNLKNSFTNTHFKHVRLHATQTHIDEGTWAPKTTHRENDACARSTHVSSSDAESAWGRRRPATPPAATASTQPWPAASQSNRARNDHCRRQTQRDSWAQSWRARTPPKWWFAARPPRPLPSTHTTRWTQWPATATTDSSAQTWPRSPPPPPMCLARTVARANRWTTTAHLSAPLTAALSTPASLAAICPTLVLKVVFWRCFFLNFFYLFWWNFSINTYHHSMFFRTERLSGQRTQTIHNTSGQCQRTKHQRIG